MMNMMMKMERQMKISAQVRNPSRPRQLQVVTLVLVALKVMDPPKTPWK
jgi:hypothetical protein